MIEDMRHLPCFVYKFHHVTTGAKYIPDNSTNPWDNLVNIIGGIDKPKHWKSQAGSARMRGLTHNVESAIPVRLEQKIDVARFSSPLLDLEPWKDSGYDFYVFIRPPDDLVVMSQKIITWITFLGGAWQLNHHSGTSKKLKILARISFLDST